MRKHFEHFLLLGGQIEVLPVSRSLTVALLSYACDNHITLCGSFSQGLEISRLLLEPVIPVLRVVLDSRTVAYLAREPFLQGFKYCVVGCRLPLRPIALPGVGPAAVNATHRVGIRAAYEYPLTLLERKHALVFQQHLTFESGPVGLGFELGRSEIRVGTGVPDRMLEKAETHLQTKHTAHGIVDSLNRHSPFLDKFLEVYAELPGGWDHSHIYSRIDGKPHRVLFACGHPVAVVQVVDVIPVGDYHSVPVQVLLEPDREKFPIGVERHSVV